MEFVDGFYFTITYHNLDNFLEVESLLETRFYLIDVSIIVKEKTSGRIFGSLCHLFASSP